MGRGVHVYNPEVKTCAAAISIACRAGVCLTILLALAGCRHSAVISKPELVFGDAGEHDGQFHMPREVGFSPDGSRLYILDRSHRVQVFRPDGSQIGS